MKSRWTVFLDRDGVLNRKAPPDDYIKTWNEFEWLPGALAALARLRRAAARLVIVSNQQGVAKGLIRPEDLEEIHRRLREEASGAGATIDGIYVCPHLEGTCDCRKPAIGLFRFAQRDFPDIDFKRSVVVGDSTGDIQAGVALGARTVHIRRPAAPAVLGAEAEAATLAEAVDQVIVPWL